MNSAFHIPSDLSEDIRQLAVLALDSQALTAHGMDRPAPALDGRPSELLTNETSVEAVRVPLMRIEYGVYS